MKNNLKALVLEDDDVFRSVIMEELKKIGFENIKAAKSYKVAMHFLAQSRDLFDVFVIDLSLGMGEKGGLDFIRQLSNQERSKTIILSSNTDSLMLEYARALAVKSYICKDSGFSVLLRNYALGIVETKGSPFLTYVRRGKDATAYLANIRDKWVESVAFIEKKESGEKYSCCVSPGTGCCYRCVFCATGTNPSTSNPRFISCLTETEIIHSIKISETAFPNRWMPVEIFFAGMGDSIDNLAVPRVMARLSDEYPDKYSFKFSSIGIKGKFERYINELIKLDVKSGAQLSLHFVRNRHLFMPATAGSTIDKTLDPFIDYVIWANTMLKINYTANNLNDSERDIEDLKNLLLNKLSLMKLMDVGKCRLIISSFNPNPFRPDIVASDERRFDEIVEYLKKFFAVQVFHSLGPDINAACGQLTALMGGTKEIILL